MRSGKEIESGWLFQIWVNVFLPLASWFWGIKVIGKENLPKNGAPAMYIGHHTTHSGDIHLALIVLYTITHSVIRGLVHRVVIAVFPILRLLGSVAGHRHDAIRLLQSGESVALIPGGGEEMCLGHQNAYTVEWRSGSGQQRCGFAHVADAARVPVIPVAGINTEEMYVSLPVLVWNYLGLSVLYDQYLLSLPGRVGQVFHLLRLYVAFTVVVLTSVPVPVKVSLVIGQPLRKRTNESVPHFARRCKRALQELLLKANGRRERRVFQALKERFGRTSVHGKAQ